MVSRVQLFRIVSHQVRHNCTNSLLLVIKHDGGTAGRTGAKLEWPLGVLIVEGLTLQTLCIVNFKIVVIEKNNVRTVLPGNTFADGAVARVVVNWVLVRMRMNMFASPSIFV